LPAQIYDETLKIRNVIQPQFYQRKDPFELQKGAASKLFSASGNRILLFVWCFEAKQQDTDVNHDEEPKGEILSIFQSAPSKELKSQSITGLKDGSESLQPSGSSIYQSHKT
jgi:hypothetical protein